MSFAPHLSAAPGIDTLHDAQGRPLTYLRLSVTDRCNLRCAYCLPAGEPACRPAGTRPLLTREQILLLAEVAAGLGVRKIRLTGGEPLLRRGLVELVAGLATVAGLPRLALTTNGVLLARHAAALRAAGLAAVNVSLDTLRPERFLALTGADRLDEVLSGLRAALAAGLEVKLNCIVLPGFNDDELAALAALALREPLTVRFIAHVPAPGRGHDLARLGVHHAPLPVGGVRRRLEERLDLQPEAPTDLSGPAREYRVVGGAGRVGIIDVRQPGLCGSCNRLRVTAAGRLRGCLFQPAGLDLVPLLGAGDREGVARALREAAARKPAGHGMEADSIRLPSRMSEIGG